PRDLHSFPTRRSSDLPVIAMSLIWTESFTSFRKGGVATNADLQAAGYVVSAQDAEWSILDDMIVPNRVVLSLNAFGGGSATLGRSEEHTSELQSRENL